MSCSERLTWNLMESYEQDNLLCSSSTWSICRYSCHATKPFQCAIFVFFPFKLLNKCHFTFYALFSFPTWWQLWLRKESMQKCFSKEGRVQTMPRQWPRHSLISGSGWQRQRSCRGRATRRSRFEYRRFFRDECIVETERKEVHSG